MDLTLREGYWIQFCIQLIAVISHYNYYSQFYRPSYFFSLGHFFQRIRPGPNASVTLRNKLLFFGEELLAPRPTLKLEDHPLSASRDCLFNVFAATVHIWRPTPPSATWGRAMLWWKGTHLTWVFIILQIKIHSLQYYYPISTISPW
jgi:hypothetical protein